MKQQIIENISNAENLERLYRNNKQGFRNSFEEIANDYNTDLIHFWKLRLATETNITNKSFLKLDLIVVIIISLITGLLVKIPELFPFFKLNVYKYNEIFYFRNLAIIVFNGIILYTLWQNKIFNKNKILIYGSVLLILALFLNLLPYIDNSDTITLSLIYTPLFLWCLFGLAYISFDYKNTVKRIEFIRFNGDFIIMTGLILIAGGLLTGITVGLFRAINIDIVELYIRFVVVFGAAASPIVSLYLIKLYPNITSKIAPVIARVFTPLVLITLIVYLVSLSFSKTKIFEDREFLIVFNIMLLAVMAIIIFSIYELDKTKKKNINVLILFLLAVVTIIINSIALVVISSRISNGLTPNRMVVLVSNILIFINLIIIAKNLFSCFFNNQELDKVENSVAKYLTIYSVWTIIVIFVIPFIFNFK